MAQVAFHRLLPDAPSPPCSGPCMMFVARPVLLLLRNLLPLLLSADVACSLALTDNCQDGAFYFVRGIVSFKGRTLVFFVFCGQNVSKNGRVRRELDVPRRARNKMEVAKVENNTQKKLQK